MQFRIRATEQLRECLVQGFAANQIRFEENTEELKQARDYAVALTWPPQPRPKKKDDRPLPCHIPGLPAGQRDYETALKWAETGLSQGCDARLLAFKAALLFREKKYQPAYIAYKELVDHGNSPGTSWLMAGYAALSSDNPEQARQAFSRACKYPKEKSTALAILNQIRARQATEKF